LIEGLIERDVCFVENVALIPDAWFPALGECLAYAASPKYGGGFDQSRINPATHRPTAEDDLKHMVRRRPTYAILATDSF
jgi:hypothetical protein